MTEPGLPTSPGIGGTCSLALFTDLYELTMAQVYHDLGMREEAVFTLSVRRLPERRNYLLACGLASVLDYLETLRFTPADVDYLRALGRFDESFLATLADFRFTGDVHAVPEGTPVFADEPILEVVAPIPEAQIVETYVMNQVSVHTVLASKAARVVEAAGGRRVVDFGPRRMHGTDAALKGARAYHIAGLDGTSNVLAGSLYGVPVVGTMAHSFIQAHEVELDAFRDFARRYPETVLLVDTFDTLEGVRNVVRLARELGGEFRVSAVRLDSGDLATLAHDARRILDAAGLERVEIILSGGLDEDAIADLVARGVPVDGFGVGTSMGVAVDVPAVDLTYKLTAYAGRDRVKLSSGKPVLPGRKQVFRMERGGAEGDTIAGAEESLPGRALLRPVIAAGRVLPGAREPLATARERARAEIAALPAAIRGLAPARPPYPVAVSEALASRQRAAAKTARARQDRGGRP